MIKFQSLSISIIRKKMRQRNEVNTMHPIQSENCERILNIRSYEIKEGGRSRSSRLIVGQGSGCREQCPTMGERKKSLNLNLHLLRFLLLRESIWLSQRNMYINADLQPYHINPCEEIISYIVSGILLQGYRAITR